MSRHIDTRNHLLDTGSQIILGRGFSAVGLAEILGTAEVPKGSFYHYFASKEAFGVAMLQRYFAEYQAQLRQRLTREDGSAHDRLLGYYQQWIANHQANCSGGGCLAVKLSGEVADLSEPMREALAEGMQAVCALIADCIRQGQQEGSISAAQPAPELGAALYSLWVGSALLSKVQRSLLPLQHALQQTRLLLQTS